MNQRWREGRDRYRPPGETINPREYEVATLPRDREAKEFVCRTHYSGSYPAARFRFGLFSRGELVGVAVFSHPIRAEVLTAVFPGDPLDSVELGRFVLLDSVPGNGESWFLGQCFRELKRQGMRGVVSFSDPVPRTDIYGSTVFPGHFGCIYQASNGGWLGRSKARTLRILPDGRVLSDRVIAKIRSGDQGWKYGVDLLCRYGAELPAGDELPAWLDQWLPRLTRKLRHHGNYRYAWDFWQPRRFDDCKAYPKQTDRRQHES